MHIIGQGCGLGGAGGGERGVYSIRYGVLPLSILYAVFSFFNEVFGSCKNIKLMSSLLVCTGGRKFLTFGKKTGLPLFHIKDIKRLSSFS